MSTRDDRHRLTDEEWESVCSCPWTGLVNDGDMHSRDCSFRLAAAERIKADAYAAGLAARAQADPAPVEETREQIKAEALREAAKQWDQYQGQPLYRGDVARSLRAMADHIEAKP